MDLWFDLRFSLRLMAKNAGFTVLCMAVVSLGMGLTLTLFTLAKTMSFSTLPVPNGERYAVLLGQDQNIGITGIDHFDYYVYRLIAQRSKSFEVLGAAQMLNQSTISDGESAQNFLSSHITPRLLQVSGIKPLLGRHLSSADSLPDAEPVVVLSHKVWQNYYAGTADIIGRYSRIDGRRHTIVGVMPEKFNLPIFHDIWLPLSIPVTSPPGEGKITPVILLNEHIDLEQANTELAAIVDGIREQYPDEYSNIGAKVAPYTKVLASNSTAIPTAMLIVSLLVLLLVCLNVGNLLAVRAGERQQELAIRAALGGTRRRVARQGLLESMLICLGGGLLGLTLAYYGISWLAYVSRDLLDGADLPSWVVLELGWSTLIAGVVITIAIWLTAGVIPVWRSASLDINGVLNGSGKGMASKNNNRLIVILVSGEVICSVLLLILSGASIHAINAMQETDYGTATDNYLVAEIDLSSSSYQTPLARYDYYRRLQNELNGEAGLQSSSLTSALPSQIAVDLPYNIEDRDLRKNGIYPSQFVLSVANNYFETMGVTLLSGRGFSSEDTGDSLPVVIVDEFFADKVWPGQSPLGKRVQLNPGRTDASRWLTIVGVNSHIVQGQPYAGLGERPAFYRPLAQYTPELMRLAIKVTGDPDQYRQVLKEVATRVDRDIAVRGIRSLNHLLLQATKAITVIGEVFVGVSVVALVLATTGIYGLISRAVLLRTKEVGLRRALGMTDFSALGLFIRQGCRYLIVGLLLGGSGGLLLSNLLAAVIPEILEAAFVAFLVVAVIMTTLVLGASYLPARKLLSVEPAVALQYE